MATPRLNQRRAQPGWPSRALREAHGALQDDPRLRLRTVARWSQPWRRQAAAAISRGFQDALAGIGRHPADWYRSRVLQQDYEAGYALAVDLIGDVAASSEASP